MSIEAPILVTGASGRIGGVGREVVEILRRRGLPVRALVRSEDDRAEALRATGAEVVVGDLTRAGDVARALLGCRAHVLRLERVLALSGGDRRCRRRRPPAGRPGGVRQHLPSWTVSQMSLTAMTGLAPAAHALVGRAGPQLVRIARGPRPGDGLPPALLLLAMGLRVDRQERHDPPPVRHGKDITDRRPGCGGSHRGRPGISGRPCRQSHRIDRAEVGGHAGRGGGVFRSAQQDDQHSR